MNVINVHNLTKVFSSSARFSETLVNQFRPPKDTPLARAVLDGISFNLTRGESFGIIGANGSGKSTLLKVLAGIVKPTSGRVEIHGRTVSVIELGAGFNIELTGYENLLLQSALYGIFDLTTDGRDKRIIEFAELQEHIRRPTKFYSSGMLARLAFSIAVHMEPDILLIDEVLSVGDAHFQAKCLARISHLQKDAQVTLVFVSHDTDLLTRVATRGLVLDAGVEVYCGEIRNAVAHYEQL